MADKKRDILDFFELKEERKKEKMYSMSIFEDIGSFRPFDL
jgi:hypothetical protein